MPGESQGREAWWASVYGVAQSQTRLKRCSRSSSSSKAILQIVCLLQWLTFVQIYATPWTAAFPVHHQVLELAQTLSIESVMPSNYLILPLSSSSPPAFNLSQHQGLFKWVSSLHQVAKVLEFQLQHLISFRMDWFDLLAVQRTLKSLLQHHSSKASVLWCSTFFMVQLSLWYTNTQKTIALTIQTFVGKVTSLLFNMLSRLVIGFPDNSVGKESACNEGDPGSVSGLGRSSGERISYPLQYSWAFLVAQLIKNPPVTGETWVWSLVWEDPLEKGKATHSSILV